MTLNKFPPKTCVHMDKQGVKTTNKLQTYTLDVQVTGKSCNKDNILYIPQREAMAFLMGFPNR